MGVKQSERRSDGASVWLQLSEFSSKGTCEKKVSDASG